MIFFSHTEQFSVVSYLSNPSFPCCLLKYHHSVKPFLITLFPKGKDIFPRGGGVDVDGDIGNMNFLSSRVERNAVSRYIVYIAEIVNCSPRDSLGVAWQ